MAWDKTSICLRILLLIAVCVFAAYFLYIHEKTKRSTDKKETFVTNIEQDYRSSIVREFNDTLHRDPYEFEVVLYRDEMKTPYDVAEIRKSLMNSQEYVTKVKDGLITPTVVNKPEKSTPLVIEADPKVVKIELDKRMDVYRSIVVVYEKNLFRMPNMKELNYYTARLSTDLSFTLDKLTQLLQMSQEYKILEKNQSNLVNVELEGQITDAQVTLIINKMYVEVYGVEPSLEIENFLKLKYQEYKFDDERFMKMLRLMYDIDKTGGVNTLEKNKKQKTSNDNVTNINDINDMMKSNKDKKKTEKELDGDTQSKKDTPPSEESTPNQEKTFVIDDEPPSSESVQPENDKSKQCAFGDDWNPSIATISTGCTKKPYDKMKFYDSLYENNKLLDIQSCQKPKPAPRNALAETSQKRNNAELSYACSRNNYYTLVDEQLQSGQVNAYEKNVLPSYRNTKWGAFLDDADDTKVGSILPKFVFKEYVEV